MEPPSPSPSPSPGLVALLETQMDEIIETFDSSEKHEYLVAVETAPHLVATETSRLKFLRSEQFNTWKACRRLVRYWHFRKKILGDDRWLLPVTQTGSSALTPSAIEVIRSGCFIPVSFPKPVILVDMTRLGRPLGHDGAQYLLYYGTTATENEALQTEGLTLVHKVSKGQPLHLLPRECWEMVRTALPLKVKNNVLIPTMDQSQKLLSEYLTHQTARVVEHNSGSSPDVLGEYTVEARLQLLESKGVPKECLPSFLGGSLRDDYFVNYIRERISVEEVLGAVIRNNTAMSNGESASSMVRSRKRPAALPKDDETETKQQKPGNRNAAHHQRWLQKQRIKRDALDEKCRLEKTYNAQLLATNQHLTGLLAQARYVVALYTSNGN